MNYSPEQTNNAVECVYCQGQFKNVGFRQKEM